MATVAQAPARSKVATSCMSWVRSRFPAASSEVSVTAAWARALEASLRSASEPLTAPSAALFCEIRFEAATKRYCCTTTPSESFGVVGVSGCVLPLLTKGAPEYSPLLTYSLTANPWSLRDAAPN